MKTQSPKLGRPRKKPRDPDVSAPWNINVVGKTVEKLEEIAEAEKRTPSKQVEILIDEAHERVFGPRVAPAPNPPGSKTAAMDEHFKDVEANHMGYKQAPRRGKRPSK